MLNYSGLITMLVMGFQGCTNSSCEPTEYFRANKIQLDACVMEIKGAMDVIFQDTVLAESQSMAIYKNSTIVENNKSVRFILENGINFVHVYRDTTVVFYFECTDGRSNRPMIIYCRGKSSNEMTKSLDLIQDPDSISSSYFCGWDNVNIAN